METENLMGLHDIRTSAFLGTKIRKKNRVGCHRISNVCKYLFIRLTNTMKMANPNLRKTEGKKIYIVLCWRDSATGFPAIMVNGKCSESCE